MELKTAACIAVGSELLGSSKLDRNSLRITEVLGRHGIEVVEKRVVGDSEDRLAAAVAELMERVDVVVVTGGLGPTADDVTREAVAKALGRELEHDHEVAGWVRGRYAAQGREVPDIAVRMARVVAGSRPLRNDRGAAPGLLVEHRGGLLAAFPGVPYEMERMLERDLEPELEARNPHVTRVRRELLLGGVFESDAETRISHLYDRFGRENVSILASYGVLRLLLTAEGEPGPAGRHVGRMERAFRDVLGDDVAGVDVAGLEEVVLEQLRDRGRTLATAESCTGGMVAARLTEVPGASEVFVGGAVSYSNELKEKLAGVSHALLVAHGAVSEPVARAMAEGARRRLGADWGLGITGVAGPGGGTDDKPVGLVHWAVAGPHRTVARHRVFDGARAVVREWSTNSALDLLRREIAAAGS
jgi:nicotinamide-nucleotide amidase